MAKRFIDTNLFMDEWVCDLSKDAKLFFIYYITTCDHAGIFRLNKRLCEFQTGIKSIDTVIKELGNSMVTVREGLYFMPKFLKFQYPGFPNCSFKAGVSALKILEQNGIDFLTVTKELPNSYGISKGKGKGKGGVGETETKKDEVKKILFKDSPFYDKMKFTESLRDWNQAKRIYYWKALDAWSAEGNKKIDWIKTVKVWASRDEKEGKLKFEDKVETTVNGRPLNAKPGDTFMSHQ